MNENKDKLSLMDGEQLPVCGIRKIGIERGNEMFEELGISSSIALIVLRALYFIVKWAVKSHYRGY